VFNPKLRIKNLKFVDLYFKKEPGDVERKLMRQVLKVFHRLSLKAKVCLKNKKLK